MICTLSNKQMDYLHALYLILHTAPLTPQSRYRAFEAAACELPPLRLSRKDVNVPAPFVCICGAKHLARAQRWARRERTEEIFKCAVPMKRDTMLSHFYGTDPVRLAIAEIADDCTVEWPDGVPVPAELKKDYTDSLDGKLQVMWTEAQIAACWVSQVLTTPGMGELE
jgi:hypothetical protein